MTDTTARPAEISAARMRLGIALCLFCAIGYGTLPSLVRLAYAGGADAMAVTLFRAGAAFSLFVTICLVRGVPVAPPRGLRLMSVGVGLVWLTGAFTYVTAIKHIAIGLAVTIFYLFPLFVALAARVIEGEKLPPARLGALVLGFAGVALAVGVAPDGAAPIGVALALAAALCLSANITFSARVMRRASPLTAMTAMTCTGTVGLLILAPWVGLSLPTSTTGWFGLLAGTVMFCLSMSSFYVALSLIGSVRAAMICNLEPAAAMLFAYLILDEALGPLQLVGAALVIGAILLMQAGEHGPAR